MIRSRKHYTTRKRLQIKIGVLLICITTFLLAGFSLYQYITLRVGMMSEIEELAETILERLAENVLKPVWDFDPDQAENVILTEMRTKSLFAVLVRTADDTLFAGKFRDEEWISDR